VRSQLSVSTHRIDRKEDIITATYTLDVLTSLDSFGATSGNWTGYWGKQGPELLDHRPTLHVESVLRAIPSSS
jgi:hypothetical protein